MDAIPEEERAGGFIKAYGKRLRGEMGDEEKVSRLRIFKYALNRIW